MDNQWLGSLSGLQQALDAYRTQLDSHNALMPSRTSADWRSWRREMPRFNWKPSSHNSFVPSNAPTPPAPLAPVAAQLPQAPAPNGGIGNGLNVQHMTMPTNQFGLPTYGG